MRGVRLLLRVCPAALLAAVAAASVASADPSTVAWSPAVTLWGGGDAGRAVGELRRVMQAADALLHRSHVDQATRATWRAALAQLDDFDLRGFHRLLPAAPDGAHELRVRGALQGGRYEIRRGDVAVDVAVCAGGARHALLDLEGALRIEPMTSDGHGPRSYRMEAQLGLGVGDVEPQNLVAAVVESARIVGGPAPTAPSPAAVAQVGLLHPRLQDEDVEVVGVVFAAYPRTGDVLSRLVEVEDVRSPQDVEGIRHVQMRLRLHPERLARHYPDLARYLRRIGPLASLQSEWRDQTGRTLAQATLDTSTLTATSECRLKEGLIVPFGGAEPVDMADTQVSLDARLELYGLGVRVRGLTFDVQYDRSPELARLRGAMTREPSAIEVDGAALGFVPPDVIDALIPGDMRGLARDFLRVATMGNAGEGIQLAVALGRDPANGDAVLDARGALEALDSRLVALGVGMVNERIVPSDAAVADAVGLLSDVHAAFGLDLDRFAASVVPTAVTSTDARRPPTP